MDCAWAGSGSRSMSITVLHILGYRKLPTMAPACIRTGLVRTVPKGDDFLGRIVAMTQTKFETSIKWMPATRFSSSKESAPYTMCCEGDVHCYVWHWWGNTAPGATSKTDGKRCLLLHVPAVPPSPPGITTKRQLVVQNPIILNDNARSHTAAVTDLLGLGNGRFWNIHRTHPIWVHVITISSPKWKNRCEGPSTAQEMNLFVL